MHGIVLVYILSNLIKEHSLKVTFLNCLYSYYLWITYHKPVLVLWWFLIQYRHDPTFLLNLNNVWNKRAPQGSLELILSHRFSRQWLLLLFTFDSYYPESYKYFVPFLFWLLKLRGRPERKPISVLHPMRCPFRLILLLVILLCNVGFVCPSYDMAGCVWKQVYILLYWLKLSHLHSLV